MSYTIGSYNLNRYSIQNDNETIQKSRANLARIINEEGFDIVALQEVVGNDKYENQALNQGLLAHLGPHWEMATALHESPVNKNYDEGFAFIWNKTRFRRVIESDDILYELYRMPTKLVRPPSFIRLTTSGLPGGSFFEIRLIDIHIPFYKPSVVRGLSDVKYRQQEMKVLAEEVFPRIADDRRYANNMPAYTIMLGDYNLCIIGNDKIRPRNPNIADGFADLPISPLRTLRTIQAERTTLKKESDSSNYYGVSEEIDAESQALEQINDAIIPNYYSKDYDHFSIDTDTMQKLNVRVSRVDALGKYYGNDLERYRREISDHVPIKLTIDLRR